MNEADAYYEEEYDEEYDEEPIDDTPEESSSIINSINTP